MPDPNYLSEIVREDGTVLTIRDDEAHAAIDGMDPILQEILQGVNDIKRSIGGGGHTVIVTTIPNAEVTLTSLDNTYTGTADNTGKLELAGVAAGTYTVSATYGDAASDTTSIVIDDHTVTEDSFASLTISASANTTITVTNGTITKTLEYTGTPIVQYVSLGTWDLSCTIDDTVITRSVLVDSYTNQNIDITINYT